MTSRSRFVRVVLIVAVAVSATVAANVALLGYASEPNDPVGKLSPTTTVATPPATAVPTAPATTTAAAEPAVKAKTPAATKKSQPRQTRPSGSSGIAPSRPRVTSSDDHGGSRSGKGKGSGGSGKNDDHGDDD